MSDQKSQTERVLDEAVAHQNECDNSGLIPIPKSEYREGRSALVIGMGLFGSAVAIKLSRLGWFVLAVDGEPEKLNQVSAHVSSVRVINAVDLEVIESLEPSQFDLCISAIGDENGHVISTTIHNLSRSGARFIIARSINQAHNEMFKRLGCHLVVEPEQHFGDQLSVLLHGLEDLQSLDHKRFDLFDLKELQQRSLEITQSQDDVSETSSQYGSTMIYKGLQLVIWVTLLQYAYQLSGRLDTMLKDQGLPDTESQEYMILGSVLIGIWVFLGRWVKPK